MADITMCLDKDCKKRKDCYRYTAQSNPFKQSYFMESPREGKACEKYIQIKNGKVVDR